MVAYLDEGGVRTLVGKVLDRIQPVGSLYFSTDNTSPAKLFGGSWERYAQGRVMVSASDTDTDFTVGKTGGEKTHKLTIDEMAKHSHVPRNSNFVFRDVNHDYGVRLATTSTPGHENNWVGAADVKVGGDRPHNNLQPYIAVYIWRRMA